MAKTNTSNKPGRYTTKYWEAKVFRPGYDDRHGERQECSTYYVRIEYAGIRRAVPLSTSDRAEAGRQAAKFYGRLRALGWDAALKGIDPQQSVRKCGVTVADVIAILNSATINKRTRDNYASALRWFAARHIGFIADNKTFGPKGSAAYRQAVEAIRLTDLSQLAVTHIIEQHEIAAGEGEDTRRSARISAASFLRNAKDAIRFAAEKGLNLPDPKPFQGVKPPRNIRPPRYVSTFDSPKLLREATDELASKPPVYAAILLALGAGLRRGAAFGIRKGFKEFGAAEALRLPENFLNTTPVGNGLLKPLILLLG